MKVEQLLEGVWVIKNKDGQEKRFKVKDSPEAKAWAASSSRQRKLHPDVKAANKEAKAKMEENIDRLVWMAIMHISEWGALDWIDLVSHFALPVLTKGVKTDPGAYPEDFVKLILRQKGGLDFDFTQLRPYFNRVVKKHKHAGSWDGYARQMAGYGRLRESVESVVDELADDIRHNWMDKDEDELFTFLKKNIDDTWMTYLKDLSDADLKDAIDQAYYIAHNS